MPPSRIEAPRFAAPAWLAAHAPEGDVVLSSRCRVMRNLRGFRFPHTASDSELLAVKALVVKAGLDCKPELQVLDELSSSEREFLVGCRLISPEFPYASAGRALLLSSNGEAGVMVNEEDHLRLQVLTPGWSSELARRTAEALLEQFQQRLQFAHSDRFGYLAASPYNAGLGRRLSSMFHLIGLAHTKRLPTVLKALTVRGLTARGLFGESSRAVGAFLQVSITDGLASEFVGACDYLMAEERKARKRVPLPTIRERAKQAIDFGRSHSSVSLADALRVLAWTRWAATEGLTGAKVGARDVDRWLANLELKGAGADGDTRRAEYLQACFG